MTLIQMIYIIYFFAFIGVITTTTLLVCAFYKLLKYLHKFIKNKFNKKQTHKYKFLEQLPTNGYIYGIKFDGKDPVYLCDILKNKTCDKTNCRNGCKYTTNKDYAFVFTDEEANLCLETNKVPIIFSDKI